jgi:hypothetical protein
MNAKITIKGISYGRITRSSYSLKTPDFQLRKIKLKDRIFNLTENEQLQDWFDQNYDNLVVSYNNAHTDFSCILEASIEFKVRRKTRKEQFTDLIRDLIPEKLIPDFVVCYMEMKDSLKGLTISKQVSIVLNTMSIGYQAQSTALKSLTEYSQNLSKGDIKLDR